MTTVKHVSRKSPQAPPILPSTHISVTGPHIPGIHKCTSNRLIHTRNRFTQVKKISPHINNRFTHTRNKFTCVTKMSPHMVYTYQEEVRYYLLNEEYPEHNFILLSYTLLHTISLYLLINLSHLYHNLLI